MNGQSGRLSIGLLALGLCSMLSLQSPVDAAELVEPPPAPSDTAPKKAPPPPSPEGKPKSPSPSAPATGTKSSSPSVPTPKPKDDKQQEGLTHKNGAGTNAGNPSPATPALPPDRTGADGAVMVLVPAGTFAMGAQGGDDDERPVHQVHLEAFYIDKVEVTIGRFAKFTADVMSEPPWGFAHPDVPALQSDQPVRWVNWIEATAYCAWAGKRLPTEAEWEKAARGTDERTYPWGNDPPSAARAAFGQMDGAEPSPPNGTRTEGKSPYGALDMAGNLYEWVADWYDEDYYGRSVKNNPRGPGAGSAKSQRGGSFTNTAYRLRSSFRTKGEPTEHHPRVGFRCAQDAPRPQAVEGASAP